MQEFESISASSYDPSALATKLTAKAAEGWSVVAIVPTGGDVTAYLCRERDGGAAPKKEAEVIEKGAASAETVEPDAAKPEPEPEPVKIEAETKPANEPSGWAIAPEPASPTPEPAAQPTAAAEPTTTYQPSLTPSSAASTPAATGPSTGPTAVAPAAAPAAAATAPSPAVPAGWYADPAGRFELRYWDGSTWTEHVSRTGQQFTDPPVA
jgi:outer membrane biosynthesis protein TonB